jgi:hypothetical protein
MRPNTARPIQRPERQGRPSIGMINEGKEGGNMNEQYRRKLKDRLASTAIGPSTARKMGPSGTIDRARAFLKSMDLAKLVTPDCDAFRQELDRVTKEYVSVIPLAWGSARKFLNIFLRDCLYNRWVCEDYKLRDIESWLEVPLDSHVSSELSERDTEKVLPRWRGVTKLELAQSEIYQRFAAQVAEAEGVARVHLDIKFWRANADT